MRAVAAGLSDVGLQREHNEDSFVVLKEHDLFVVADGMGGHRAGDVASRIATETISEFFKSTANEDVTWPFHFDTNLSEEENRLLTGIRVANRQIFERSTRSREYHGMGTTVVSASMDIRDACRKLIQRANERGGEDNITAVVIRIEEETTEETRSIPEHNGLTAGRQHVPEGFAEEATMPGTTNLPIKGR